LDRSGPAAPGVRTRGSLGVGLALLGVALAWFALTAAPLDPHTTTYRALGPYPDAPEYLDAAVCFLETGRFEIDIAGQRLPSRYPPGYSLLLATALAAGVEPLEAPLAVNRVLAVTLPATAWGFFAWAGRPVAGGLTALLLAVQPWFILVARSPLSELAALWPAAVGAGLLFRGGRRSEAAGAALLGLSIGVRIANLFLAPLAIAASWGDRRGMVRNLGAFVAGCVPLAAWQWATFGSPFATGYGFWLAGAERDTFSLSNAPAQLAMLANELIQNEAGPSVAWVYGAGSYIGPATLVLAAWAAVRLWRRRRPRRFLFATAAFAAPLLFYHYADFRLYLPIAATAVVAVGSEWPRIWAEAGTVRRVTAGFLLTAALIGLPGRRSELEALDMARALHLDWESREAAALDAFQALDPEPGAVALTDLNPPLIHALTGGRVSAAPLTDEHDYRFAGENFSFGEADRARFLEEARARGATVYTVRQGAATVREP